MRELDRRAVVDHALPVRALMEVAAAALAARALVLRDGQGPAIFLCGGGHNGGDGLAAARHVAAAGVAAEVFLWAESDRLSEAPAANLALLAATRVTVQVRPDIQALAGRLATAGVVVDCLLGTGFRGGVRAPLAEVIAAINGCGRPVLAADIPSGLTGEPGEAPDGPCVQASATLCFGAIKAGLLAPPGRCWAGEVGCAPLGIPEAAWQGLDILEGLEDATVAPLLPARSGTGHKGTYGTVLTVGGAVGFAGAAALCAEGALRAGCGLSQVVCPAPVQPTVAGLLREATVQPLPADAEGMLAAEAASSAVLGARLAVADVLAVGPGLGRGLGVPEVLRHLLRAFTGPLVLDADGLNAVDLPAIAMARGSVVITPHPGEAARLLGCATATVQADRLAAVRNLAASGRCVAVLKGAGTLTATAAGAVALCPTGNDGMGTGGSGDVLTGVIAGLLAQGAAPWDAVRAGVYVHGRAGDLAKDAVGRRALLAGDILRHLGAAFTRLAAGAGGAFLA